ncbi:pyridoxamine 5'-phosphate oxidase family protein [Spirillospora sp. NPDC048911]|uniref:pyridoxamine 5'-phosphate oxidase family protein n=1 Tax=Spirillospora sp. NPDC048911 TaxID=3364527 RepID=UPI003720C834
MNIETKNLDIYGAAPLPWSRARDGVVAGLPKMETPIYLGTVRPDGRPHSAGVGMLWLDDELYFTSGPGTRKSRNLAANPACTASMRLEGLDLVIEGTAERVEDPDLLARVAEGYAAGGWPAESDGEGLTAPFSAPSAGPPPWHVYRFVYEVAFGVATAEPHGATRWTFTRS